MSLHETFGSAIKLMSIDYEKAKASFEKVNLILNNKPLSSLNDDELRIYALSNIKLFIISNLVNLNYANRAIEAFEKYFINNSNSQDIEMYDSYILSLELTYQYKRSHEVLLNLLYKDKTRSFALKRITSKSYLIEGLQTLDEHKAYLNQLIELTIDIQDKERYQRELYNI